MEPGLSAISRVRTCSVLIGPLEASIKDSLYSLAESKKLQSVSPDPASISAAIFVSASMYFFSKLEILSLLVRQICCHMAGEEEAMRVISLKPPAAVIFMMPASESASLTRLTREAATTWGRWEMAAVTQSCSSKFRMSGIAPMDSTSVRQLCSFCPGTVSEGVRIQQAFSSRDAREF